MNKLDYIEDYIKSSPVNRLCHQCGICRVAARFSNRKASHEHDAGFHCVGRSEERVTLKVRRVQKREPENNDLGLVNRTITWQSVASAFEAGEAICRSDPASAVVRAAESGSRRPSRRRHGT